jgi:hypothetical protein
MNNDYDAQNLPGLKPLTWGKKLLLILAWPYMHTKASIKVLCVRKNNNVIKKNLPMTGRKNGAFYKDFDAAQMKLFCKKKGCTINDYASSLISTSFYELFERYPTYMDKEYAMPDYIDIGMPFSMRQPF